MRIPTILATLALATAAGTAITCTEPTNSASGSPDLSISAARQQSGPKVKSVSVSPSSASIAVGATRQLTATTSPNTSATFTWGSSNSSVATVSQSGLVTGVAPGSATVSASTSGKTGNSAITVAGAPPPPPPPPNAVFVGAGDIASCSSTGDEATASLLDGISGTVFTLGDNAYETGSTSEFANCYNPSWGRFKSRTKPAPGNHDYGTAGASAYYAYFGSAAGDPAKGYYSYDLGDWHIVAINSNIAYGAGSVQEQWLRADLAANTKSCTLAYWHHPRFSSGFEHGSDPSLQPIWQALYDGNADVVLSGHDHDYERFALQTPTGAADATRGIREFVVGTGGRSHYSLGTLKANSQVFDGTTFGVLKMTLMTGSYTWQFVPVAGGTFTDSGSGICH